MDELNNGEQGQYVEPGKNEKKNNTRKIVKRTLITAGARGCSVYHSVICSDRRLGKV